MTMNTEVVAYDHELHAYIVEAEQKWAQEYLHRVEDIAFDVVMHLYAEAFMAGQRHPSKAASYRVQHVGYDKDGQHVEEWEVANATEVIATSDNEAEAVALARQMNGGERCGACEAFEMLARKAGAEA